MVPELAEAGSCIIDASLSSLISIFIVVDLSVELSSFPLAVLLLPLPSSFVREASAPDEVTVADEEVADCRSAEVEDIETVFDAPPLPPSPSLPVPSDTLVLVADVSVEVAAPEALLDGLQLLVELLPEKLGTLLDDFLPLLEDLPALLTSSSCSISVSLSSKR